MCLHHQIVFNYYPEASAEGYNLGTTSVFGLTDAVPLQITKIACLIHPVCKNIEPQVHASTLPKPSKPSPLNTGTLRRTSANLPPVSNVVIPVTTDQHYEQNAYSNAELNLYNLHLLADVNKSDQIGQYIANQKDFYNNNKNNKPIPRLSIHDIPPPNFNNEGIISDLVVPPPLTFGNIDFKDDTLEALSLPPYPDYQIPERFDDSGMIENYNIVFDDADIDKYLIPSPPPFQVDDVLSPLKTDFNRFNQTSRLLQNHTDNLQRTLLRQTALDDHRRIDENVFSKNSRFVYYDDTIDLYNTSESLVDIPPPLPNTPPPPLSNLLCSTTLVDIPHDPITFPKSVSQSNHPSIYNSKTHILQAPSLFSTNMHDNAVGIASKHHIHKGNVSATYKPPQSPKSKLSVSDKKKFFENAMEESQHPSPKPEKVFSYLSADEVERMRAEEERKIATLSRAEINSLSALDNSDDESVDSQPARPASTIGIVRTAKAERRLRDRLREEGLLTDEDDFNLSPAEERTLRAEKRAAWRQARLKSLEQDAIQAQMVIKSMTDMVASGEIVSASIQKEDPAKPAELRPSSADFPKLAVRSKPGNTTVRESEKILGETITQRTEEYVDDMTGEKRVRTVEYIEKLIEREVETLQEKIISLELTKSEDGVEVAVNGKNKCVDDDENESEELTTPTTTEDRSLGEESNVSNKKKKRKRSKKGKH